VTGVQTCALPIFARIKAAAKKIQSDSDILVVIGIGGSYLGARMAVDFLHNTFYQAQKAADRKYPLVLFAGNSLSSTYVHDLIELIGDKDFPSMLFQSQEQPLNHQLPSESLRTF